MVEDVKENNAESKVQVSDLDWIGKSPLVDELLQAAGGLFALLSEDRHVLAMNTNFLERLGISDASQQLGLRLGDVFHCIRAEAAKDGCGTTKFCPTCGAAVAMVTALAQNQTAERHCAMQVHNGKRGDDIFLSVRATPIHIEGRRFLLLYLHDITLQQKWHAMDRMFYHDLNNLLNPLLGASDMLYMDHPDPDEGRMIHDIRNMAIRLTQEVRLQQLLQGEESKAARLFMSQVFLESLFAEQVRILAHHPSGKDVSVRIQNGWGSEPVATDAHILGRVLFNMLLNAAEASVSGTPIVLKSEKIVHADTPTLRLSVWNTGHIAPDVTLRIFQRNFSTKPGTGRGLGTWSMKVFGEDFLGGKIGFESSVATGTTFWLDLKIS